MRAVLTVDVERDCPPYLNTFRGVEEGLPRLLDLLDNYGIRGTFFVTGTVAEHFRGKVLEIAKKHEVGSHGMDHRRLDRMPLEEAKRNVEASLKILRKFYPVVSFRAPNLKLPEELFQVLGKLGIKYDSSKALYKGWTRGTKRIAGVLEIPASITSSVLRLPWRVQRILHDMLPEPRVYFVHPWEFVPLKGVRPDCTFNTGEKALKLLEELLVYLDRRGFEFYTLEGLGREIERERKRSL